MTASLRARTTLLGVFLFCGLSACRQQVPHYSDALMPQQQPHAETAAETQVAASFAGCYELRLGRWWPWGFGKENAYVTPPSRIQLITERGAQGFEQDGYLIRPMKSPTTGRGGPSYWQVKSDEKIDLIWTDGFTGVTL